MNFFVSDLINLFKIRAKQIFLVLKVRESEVVHGKNEGIVFTDKYSTLIK